MINQLTKEAIELLKNLISTQYYRLYLYLIDHPSNLLCKNRYTERIELFKEILSRNHNSELHCGLWIAEIIELQQSNNFSFLAELVDKDWFHMNNTHSNLLSLVLIRNGNFRIHRKTGMHLSAWFLLFDVRKQGRLKLMLTPYFLIINSIVVFVAPWKSIWTFPLSL